MSDWIPNTNTVRAMWCELQSDEEAFDRWLNSEINEAIEAHSIEVMRRLRTRLDREDYRGNGPSFGILQVIKIIEGIL